MARLKLASPWVRYYRQISTMFELDPDVRVIYDEEENEIKLYVDNANKAEALTQLLPAEKVWGNVTQKVTVIPANTGKLSATKFDLVRAAFEGNEALSFIATAAGIYSNPIHYVVFVNKVVQYWTDDLGDIYGQCSTLYQDLAKEIFDVSDTPIYFCTDKPTD